MRKILFVFLISVILASCGGNNTTKNTPANSGSENNTVMVDSGKTSNAERIEQAKKRLQFRAVIDQGDYFFLKDDKTEALRYYLGAYLRLKGDHILEGKIAGLAFDLHDYARSSEYYQKIPFGDLTKQAKERFELSLEYQLISTGSDVLLHLPVSADQMEYFNIIRNCQSNIHDCVIQIQNSTGSYQPTMDLRDIVNNYTQVSSDLQYRNARLAETFFAQKQYLTAGKICDEIILHRPDYQAVLKIGGFAYYEIGNYYSANTILQKLYAITPSDTSLAYTLGMINYYLKDYSTSNTYLNTAVLNGYTPKTELERRLVYNYFLMGDQKNVIKVFRYLLEEPDATVTDFSIAIWTASEDAKELSKASLWSTKADEKFPNDESVLALNAWVAILKDDEPTAQNYVNQTLAMDSQNPLATLVKGILFLKQNDYTNANLTLQQAKTYDTDGTFANEISKQMIALEQSQSTSEQTSSGTVVH